MEKASEKGKINVVVYRVEPESKDDCGIRVQVFYGEGEKEIKELQSVEPKVIPSVVKTKAEKIRMSCPVKIMTFSHL